MITCPKCGELNGNDRANCFKCGSSLNGSSTVSGRANRICPKCKRVFYNVPYTECPNCHVPMPLYSLAAKKAAEGQNPNYRPTQAPPKKEEEKPPEVKRTSFDDMFDQLGLESYDDGAVKLFKMVDQFFPFYKATGELFDPEILDAEGNAAEIANIQASSYWLQMIQIRQNQIIIDLLMKLAGEKNPTNPAEEE